MSSFDLKVRSCRLQVKDKKLVSRSIYSMNHIGPYPEQKVTFHSPFATVLLTTVFDDKKQVVKRTWLPQIDPKVINLKNGVPVTFEDYKADFAMVLQLYSCYGTLASAGLATAGTTELELNILATPIPANMTDDGVVRSYKDAILRWEVAYYCKDSLYPFIRFVNSINGRPEAEIVREISRAQATQEFNVKCKQLDTTTGLERVAVKLEIEALRVRIQDM